MLTAIRRRTRVSQKHTGDATRGDWQTPAHIVEALGPFDLDPCANINNPFRLAACGYPTGGLDLPWHGRVWCNPPYGTETYLWMQRLADHGNGIALIPPRMETVWFQEDVLGRCSALLFLRGRLAFLDENLRPVKANNSGSALVAFGAFNADVLAVCGLPGKYWRLTTH